jgi:hypothetical protein
MPDHKSPMSLMRVAMFLSVNVRGPTLPLDVENFVPLSARLSPDGGRRVSRRVIAADYGFHKLKWCSELFDAVLRKKAPCPDKKA